MVCFALGYFICREPSKLLNLFTDSLKERGQDIQEFMALLLVETKADIVRDKDAREKKDRCKFKVQQSECLVRSYENQKVDKALKIDTLIGEGLDVDREKIKMEGIMEQLADEEARLQSFRVELDLAQSIVDNTAHGIEAHCLQLQALEMELFHIRSGKNSGTFWPRPIVYSEEMGTHNFDDSSFLQVSTCSMCQFSFPNYNIIVSCCRHLYHPFCALVVFARGGACIAKGC